MTPCTDSGNPLKPTPGTAARGAWALFLKSATAATLAAAVISTSPQAQAKPTDYECALNRQDAANAASEATRSEREAESAVRTLAIGGTCALTLWMAGASEKTITVVCGLASAGATAAAPPAASAETASKAYRDALNPECYPNQN